MLILMNNVKILKPLNSSITSGVVGLVESGLIFNKHDKWIELMQIVRQIEWWTLQLNSFDFVKHSKNYI